MRYATTFALTFFLTSVTIYLPACLDNRFEIDNHDLDNDGIKDEIDPIIPLPTWSGDVRRALIPATKEDAEAWINYQPYRWTHEICVEWVNGKMLPCTLECEE